MVNTPQANSSPTGKGGAFRKQVIDAATTKLDQTAKVMQTFTENYQKASDKLVDVQLKIGEIQAELASLQADNIDLVLTGHPQPPHFYIKWICVRILSSTVATNCVAKIYRTKSRLSSSSASTSLSSSSHKSADSWLSFQPSARLSSTSSKAKSRPSLIT